MNTLFFNFLIESSICLLFFLAIYRLVISNLTHFNWMRGYLLSGVALSIILPLIKIPEQWSKSLLGNALFEKPLSLTMMNPLMGFEPQTIQSEMQTISPLNGWASFIFVFSTIYFIGVLLKSFKLFSNLLQIRKSIQKSPKHKEGKYWIVNKNREVAAFSFLNFIFINEEYKNLTPNEIQQIKDHEFIHAKQQHTIDILFIEIISILFWFNPLVYYAKTKLQEIHEYIADEKTAGQGEMKKRYAQLLFNLASDTKAFYLSTGFSGKQINNRIKMVSKMRSLPRYKLVFITLLPVTAFLLLSFSYLNNPSAAVPTNKQNTEINSSPKIGTINWVNNTIINIDGLNNILGLKTGDEYIKKNFENRIWSDLDGVSTYYLDKGYVFSNFEIVEKPTNKGTVDLTITIYEGNKSKIGKVSIQGNKLVSTEEILAKISVKQGDLFSKTKIVESVRALSNMGKFDNETIKPNLNPLPKESNSDFAIVDITFEVTEK